MEGFLKDLDAADLCEKRQATWGEHNTLRWIVWHLVEHDQHHRAQIYTRIRMLGRIPPPIWPRPQVMGGTPAGGWGGEVVDPKDLVPFWKPLHTTLREAVSALSDADLTFSPAPGQPSVHDLVLHLFIEEGFLIRQVLAGDAGTPRGKIQSGWGQVDGCQLGREAGPAFPTVALVLEGMDAVHAATRQTVGRMTINDLVQTRPTRFGPETVHHTLWYTSELRDLIRASRVRGAAEPIAVGTYNSSSPSNDQCGSSERRTTSGSKFGYPSEWGDRFVDRPGADRPKPVVFPQRTPSVYPIPAE